ncbi:unnamed protein product [Brassica oleracea var. botrytis]
MLVLLLDCSCTDFGQLMHHVSTHISTLAFLVNSSCTDLDMSSSFDELIDACSRGGSNLSDKGLNLSGSWQQGHSATYNTPSKGSIGHAFTVHIRTENQNQTSFYLFVPHEISVLVELILGHLRYLLTNVPPQPNSRPDNVLHLDRHAKASLGSKRRGCYPAGAPTYSTPLNRILLVRTGSEFAVRRLGKAPERAVPSPSPGRHKAVRSRHVSSSGSPPTVDGFGTGTPDPALRANPFPKVMDLFCDFPCLHCSIDQRLFTLET